MNQFEAVQTNYIGNEPHRSRPGFALAVTIILLFLGLIIFCFARSYHQITDAADARLVYLAATAKAIELKGLGNYRVPVQSVLIEYIGEDVNQDAVIQVDG